MRTFLTNLIRWEGLLALLAIIPAAVSATPLIHLGTPLEAQVVGSTFAMDVLKTDLKVGGYDLDLSFDGSLLLLTASDFDIDLGDPASSQDSIIGFGSAIISGPWFSDAVTLPPAVAPEPYHLTAFAIALSGVVILLRQCRR